MPGFPEFALDRELRACVVTRELAHQIEKQLLATERDLLGEDPPASDRRFDVSVIDAFGGETFRSAASIPTTGFPKSTETVRLFLESSVSERDGEDAERWVRIKLAFREAHGNRLSIRMGGPQAREKAIGLYERILQLVESETIDSWIFRRRDWVVGSIGLLLFLGGLVWAGNSYAFLRSEPMTIQPVSYWLLTAGLVTAGSYLGIIYLFFPRCAFETNRWATIQQWRTWAAQGFVGLVLFDSLLFALGRRIGEAIGLTTP
jgi:hypothetical protein